MDRPNNKEVTKAEKPVFPPAPTPVVDSTKVVTVVAPIPAPTIVEIASTWLALAIHFGSALPKSTIRSMVIKLPVVSKKSMYKNERTPT